MTRVLVRDCVVAAAEVWGVTPLMIAGRRRWGAVVEARQAAMWLAAALTGQSEAEIARRLDRDASTVRHGIARIARRQAEDPVLRAMAGRAERLARALAEARGSARETAALLAEGWRLKGEIEAAEARLREVNAATLATIRAHDEVRGRARRAAQRRRRR